MTLALLALVACAARALGAAVLVEQGQTALLHLDADGNAAVELVDALLLELDSESRFLRAAEGGRDEDMKKSPQPQPRQQQQRATKPQQANTFPKSTAGIAQSVTITPQVGPDNKCSCKVDRAVPAKQTSSPRRRSRGPTRPPKKDTSSIQPGNAAEPLPPKEPDLTAGGNAAETAGGNAAEAAGGNAAEPVSTAGGSGGSSDGGPQPSAP